MSRGGSKVTKHSNNMTTGFSGSWLDALSQRISQQGKENAASEPIQTNSEYSIFDQINSIMGNKPTRHASVESAVAYYQERTGLKEYLHRIQSSQENNNTKTAQEGSGIQLPASLQKLPEKLKESVLSYVRNTIEDRKGFIDLPALQFDILSMFRESELQEEDIENPETAKFLNTLIIQEQQKHPDQDGLSLDLGRGMGKEDFDEDNSNSDFFKGLLAPSK